MKSLSSFQLPTQNFAKCSAILLFSALLFLNTPLFAQNENLIFERINTSHGLTNNSVRRIFQDSKGYLWVGTQDGLNKYDGYKFINYRHDPQDSTSLSNNLAYEDGPPRYEDLQHTGYGNVCINRHSGGMNMLFMDWSVRKVGLKEPWTLKWHRRYDTANRWTRAGGAMPEDWPEWMRSFRDY